MKAADIAAGGTQSSPQAVAAPTEVHNGELVDASWPRPVRPHEWQRIMSIVELLTTHQGHIATELYEVSRDDVGCIHVIIGRPIGRPKGD